MATTVERLTKFQGEWFTTAAISLILANAKILKGVLGMQVAGKAQKAGIGQAGAKLLGIAEKTYDNSAVGTDTTLASPMIFRRGACFLDNSGVSPVTGADLGGLVLVEDETTVKTGSAGAGDMTLIALELIGTQVLCLIV